jgi:hypothetical protein
MHGLRPIWSIGRRRSGRVRLPLGLAIACLIAAGACASSTSTAGATANSTATPSAGGLEVPSAPAQFTATWPGDPVACPDEPADSEFMCYRIEFGWQSASGPDTHFRIYDGWTGEGDPMPACADLTPGEIHQLMDTEPGARQAEYYAALSVGGGQQCFWLSAVNAAGESGMVEAESNWEARFGGG